MANVNEELDRLHSSLGLPDSDFFCECGHASCSERITLSRGEYASFLATSRPLLIAAHANREHAAETELQELRRKVDQLQRSLTSRENIEQAKGVLAEREEMTLDDAFESLRQRARDQRLSLDKVCAEIIASLEERGPERSNQHASGPALPRPGSDPGGP